MFAGSEKGVQRWPAAKILTPSAIFEPRRHLQCGNKHKGTRSLFNEKLLRGSSPSARGAAEGPSDHLEGFLIRANQVTTSEIDVN